MSPAKIIAARLAAGEDLYETPPISEERVEVYARLLSQIDKEPPSYPPLRAYARVLAAREARGEITYEDIEDHFYPNAYLRRMREVPPESRDFP